MVTIKNKMVLGDKQFLLSNSHFVLLLVVLGSTFTQVVVKLFLVVIQVTHLYKTILYKMSGFGRVQKIVVGVYSLYIARIILDP